MLQIVQAAVTEVRKEVSLDIKPPRRTIFHELMDPPADGNQKRLQLSDIAVFADAVAVTGAGTETTGATIQRGVFELLSNSVAYEALTAELRGAFPTVQDMNLTALEKLPFLSGLSRRL